MQTYRASSSKTQEVLKVKFKHGTCSKQRVHLRMFARPTRTPKPHRKMWKAAGMRPLSGGAGKVGEEVVIFIYVLLRRR